MRLPCSARPQIWALSHVVASVPVALQKETARLAVSRVPLLGVTTAGGDAQRPPTALRGTVVLRLGHSCSGFAPAVGHTACGALGATWCCVMQPVWRGVSAGLDSNVSCPSKRALEGSLGGRNSDQFRRVRTGMLDNMPFPGATEVEDAEPARPAWKQLSASGSRLQCSVCGSRLPPAAARGSRELRRGVPTSPSR